MSDAEIFLRYSILIVAIIVFLYTMFKGVGIFNTNSKIKA
jgi:hypothetical protein